MKWVKNGLIFKAENNYDWMQTHAQLPIADKIDDERLRIYFGTRDKQNRTVTTYIEVEADNPQNTLYVHNKTVLGLGGLGCFDDSGVMPSCLVNYDHKKYLYYIGWNVGRTVPYRNSIGIAVSNDNGLTFNRLYEGPILDRTPSEPHFTASSFVLIENGVWRMWYLSTVRWEVYDGTPEPYYHLKYTESKDGIHWNRKGIVCIDFKSPDEGGISRPCVIKDNGIYKMWYSYRGGKDYRGDKEQSYRIGYAESDDGIEWIRKDKIVGIDISETGWDSEMIEYPYIYEHKGEKYMLYNGNGFGRSGFGYAFLERETYD